VASLSARERTGRVVFRATCLDFLTALNHSHAEVPWIDDERRVCTQTRADASARRYFTGKPASLWRPVVTRGHAPLGDVLVEGSSPPSRPVCVAPRAHPGAAAPVRFRLAWRSPKTSGGGVQVSVWLYAAGLDFL